MQRQERQFRKCDRNCAGFCRISYNYNCGTDNCINYYCGGNYNGCRSCCVRTDYDRYNDCSGNRYNCFVN